MQKQTDFNIPKHPIPIVLAISSLFYLAGCIPIYIPTPEHGYSHMEEVNKDMVKQLEPGTTTKEDMRMLFGNPDMYFGGKKGNSISCYCWKRKDGYWGVILIGPGAGGWKGGSTEDEHAFCLEFMPDGKLERFKFFESDWYKKEIVHQITDWADEEN